MSEPLSERCRDSRRWRSLWHRHSDLHRRSADRSHRLLGHVIGGNRPATQIAAAVRARCRGGRLETQCDVRWPGWMSHWECRAVAACWDDRFAMSCLSRSPPAARAPVRERDRVLQDRTGGPPWSGGDSPAGGGRIELGNLLRAEDVCVLVAISAGPVGARWPASALTQARRQRESAADRHDRRTGVLRIGRVLNGREFRVLAGRVRDQSKIVVVLAFDLSVMVDRGKTQFELAADVGRHGRLLAQIAISLFQLDQVPGRRMPLHHVAEFAIDLVESALRIGDRRLRHDHVGIAWQAPPASQAGAGRHDHLIAGNCQRTVTRSQLSETVTTRRRDPRPPEPCSAGVSPADRGFADLGAVDRPE